jgi:polysaccharide export outer membrane protein
VNYRDYQVGPEDLLEVQVFGHDNLNRQVRINGQGQISLPLVGVVQVVGLSPQRIEKRLVEAYGTEFLRNPQVNVTVKEYRHQRVAVTGAVDKPGQYEMIGPRTLLEMLAQAGGLQDKPGAKAGDKVHVIRRQNAPELTRAGSGSFSPHSETLVIDLHRLLQAGAAELNIPIRHGDVIHVPFAGNAYVLGGVRKPGSVAVKDNLTLTQAVALAGGIDPVLATNSAHVLRLDKQGKPLNITANLARVMSQEERDIPLNDNDVVVVGESSVKKALFVFKELLPGATSGAYRFAN